MIGYWMFMLAMVLLIPGVMIGLGKMFSDRPPREINPVSGYRSAMSMKNRDTWQFAHEYCGKLWVRLGWFMLPISAVPMLFVFNGSIDVISVVGGIVCCVQIVPLLATIVLTEIALRRTFDKNGKRKGDVW